MTGGIGFSRQAKQSFEDNHKLGKIRTKSIASGTFLKRTAGEESSLSESIAYLQSLRQKRRKTQIWISSLLAFFSLLFLLVLMFFN
ncbi:hypothetical protein Aconfl_22490 [Algoriphagus confluentis]|uniref:Uncharacterized protein n=1 Tax=Algoriphagus confluentis TaxID=1697556 RepID=A0ABQ6PNT7_9BACT|nr:hypothetical protein Aconfl_22490 [Algoriphagus confluentis]